MSSKSPIPDYELAEKMVITAPGQLRAIADPLRDTLLDLLLERAATVGELAAAVNRPKSTVAHHVNVLVQAGEVRSILRHARIPREHAAEFWDRVLVMAGEFAQVPRSGDTVYGFAAGLYPTDYPTLPDAKDQAARRPAKRKASPAKRTS